MFKSNHTTSQHRRNSTNNTQKRYHDRRDRPQGGSSFNRKNKTRPPRYNRTKIQRNIMMDLLERQNTASFSLNDVTKMLGPSINDTDAVLDNIKALIHQGYIVRIAHNTFRLSDEVLLDGDRLEGSFSLTTKGFGFVSPKKVFRKEFPQEIFINRLFVNNAMSEDMVRVRILRKTPKGFEGVIENILSFNNKNIVCNITSQRSETSFLGFHPLFAKQNMIVHKTEACPEISLSDRVLVAIDREDTDMANKHDVTAPDSINCNALKVLGSMNDPNIDNSIAVIEHNIREAFPEEALLLANSFTEQDIRPTQTRRDLRDMITITIDPSTSKDFDDAISLKKSGNHFELFVHIADVTHYVQESSALDLESKTRSNSVYLPGECIPMLPNALSDNICSLMPQTDRFAFTIFMKFDRNGDIVDSDIFESIIHSDHRFSYEQARIELESEAPTTPQPIHSMLKEMQELAHILKTQRRNGGFIEFSLDDIKVLVDERGRPITIEREEYDITHQMIELFMVSANKVAADFVTKHLGKNKGIFRVHDKPTNEKSSDFVKFVQSLGININFPIKRKEIQKILDQHAGTPVGDLITVAYIQHMQQAVYSNINKGHYGLNLESYCHFTSPIRRYADLVIHRIIKQILNDQQLSYTIEDLEAVAEQCSLSERNAGRAESSTTKLKKLRLLKHQLQTQENVVETALVTNVSNFFVSIQLPNYAIDGQVHISNLNGFFEFIPEAHEIRSKHGKKVFKLGSIVKAKLLNIDLNKLHAEWSIID